MYKCTGINVTEVGANNTPMTTAILQPVDATDKINDIRILGGAGSIAATMAYGKHYQLAEVETPVS